ncbi:hypothetical protein C2S51_035979 [Perilla frutescens var. frutescens]|nr:hypothetical protein C2S51_035979 [Perilla frutescens var. frutescens]
MDSRLNGHPTLTDSSAASDRTAVIPPEPSSSRTNDGPQIRSAYKRKINKKKQTVVSDTASFDSSSNCSYAASNSQKGIKISRNPKRIRVGPVTAGRKSVRSSDVDTLGLPLGMSIAVVVSQVLEEKNAAGEKMSVDYLSVICGLAVKESLGNVFGDKFDIFVKNFETSFRSTLLTLQLIRVSSQNDGEQLQRSRLEGCSCSVTGNMTSRNTHEDSPCSLEDTVISKQPQREDGTFEASSLSSHYTIGDSSCCSSNTDGPVAFSDRTRIDSQCRTHSAMEQKVMKNLISQQLVLHDKRMQQQLTCAFPSNSSSNPVIDQFSMLSTIEKSVMEQTRSNDLKTFEIGISMTKLELKKKELELKTKELDLSYSSNILERVKMSMGISKASFKVEKFKTELQDTRQVELLKKCLDFLVGGLIIMLFSLAYGTYVYSHRRIIEATEACSPYTESSSWWMPKSMSTFNSGLQLLKCQIQVFSRMLFGVLMIGAIAFLLIQRSATSHQAMPVTVILLLLGVGCGYAGKFCIDTLGGSGNHWLIFWEVLCLLHFFSNIFHSTLFSILNGPIVVAERIDRNSVFPYWMRKSVFYATLLVLPLLCGLMPFASPWEWCKHFSSQAADLLTFEDEL